MIPNYRYIVREISGVVFKGMVVVGSSLDNFLQHDGNPDDLFLRDARLLKSSESSSNALVRLNADLGAISEEEVFVKEFRFKNTLHSLKPLFRRHNAQVIWRVSWHLLQHHIAVPEPIGYLLKQKGLYCVNGYYFSKAVPDCTNLGKLAVDKEHLRKRLDSESLTEALAGDIASLHNCGVIHGDLKWTNILVHVKRNMLWFVDLDSAKLREKSPGPVHVARDLARFVLNGLEVGVDPSVMDTFLAAYADERKLTRDSIAGPMNKALAKLRKRHAGKGAR